MPPSIYPFVMLAAVIVCSVLLRKYQEALPIQPLQKLAIAIGAFTGAMLGAKLPFVASQWPDVLSPQVWFAHGKTIMAGIVGGYFGVELAKWLVGVQIKTGDTFAVPVAVAVAIGRVGCFAGGCCFGNPTKLAWGVSFPLAHDATEVMRHPTQLYEAAFHGGMAGVLWWLLRSGYLRGQLIKFYILCYLAYRFVTEWIRPEPRMWAGLTAYQWAAIPLFVLFFVLWHRDAKRFAASGPSIPVA